jgi:acylpyruvate hydrolase
MIFRVGLRDGKCPANTCIQIPELIKHCSSIMTLEEGDLLLTGTPSGVGPIRAGDKIEAALSSEGDVKLAWSGSVRDRPGGYRFQA